MIAYYCSGVSACENNNWGDSITPTQIWYRQYTWFDWNYAGPTGYNLQNDLVRAVGIDVKVNFGYAWGGQFGLSTLSANDVVVTGAAAPSYLSFPLAGETAYTAGVSSVMDHSMTALYAGDTNNTVTAFNGEAGTVGPYGSSTCYRKTDSSVFLVGTINYTGAFSGGGDTYLCYNGHPGYDYPKVQGTAILAPAGGTLCVATATPTSKPTPSAVWRNTSQCPLSVAPGTSTVNWSSHHVFYILHGSMLMNGSTDEYMTVFLHSNNLESTVLAGIYDDGYKVVTRLQEIAAVGDIGASGAYHIHLEVYKKVSGTWNRVDPYGDGTSNLLWPKPY